MGSLLPYNKNGFGLSNFGDFYNVLDDFFNDSWLSRRRFFNNNFKLDVKENENNYSIDAELPGIKKEEINIDFNDGKLSISVNREEKIEEENKNYIHKETNFSSMQRCIYLADAKADEISAKLEDGILKIIIPKTENIKNSYKIEIE